MARQPEIVVTAPQRTARNAVWGAALAATLGVSVSTVALIKTDTEKQEAVVYRAYKDPGGVWTICAGDTENVKPGEIDTPEQCAARTERQLERHYAPIVACVPQIKGHANQIRALGDLGYNAGAVAACGSTTATLFRQGQWAAGCKRLMDWSSQWAAKPIKGALSCKPRVKGGKDGFQCVLPGLVTRRTYFVNICLQELPS